MQRPFISIALAVSIVLAVGAYAQQTAKQQQLPNELVQYVRDARKAGIDEQQIRQNALNAGWPAEVVSGAIEEVLHAGAEKTAISSSAEATDANANEITPAKASEPSPAPAAAAPAAKGGEPTPAAAAAAPSAGAPKGTPGPAMPAVIDRGVPDDYQIGAGDELQIAVWREPDASVPNTVVRPDGKISMPILKEVSVIGLTPTQAEEVITEQLVKFISAADVTVIVKGVRSKKIYVVGGVKKEEPIPYTYRMTILQAISEAGGLSDYAKRKKIYILRHENGRDYHLPFDYDAVLRGEKMELNIPLLPGDTLVVPK